MCVWFSKHCSHAAVCRGLMSFGEKYMYRVSEMMLAYHTIPCASKYHGSCLCHHNHKKHYCSSSCCLEGSDVETKYRKSRIIVWIDWDLLPASTSWKKKPPWSHTILYNDLVSTF